jgi:hypothetical protein
VAGQTETVERRAEHVSRGRKTKQLVVSPYGHLGVLGVFAFFSVLMTWPLALHMSSRLVTWGDPVFQAWTLAWNVHAWTTDPLNVFNTNVLYPYRNTLAYSDHLFGQTLMIAPLRLITDNPILVDNISRLSALTLTGFFMYLLVYDMTGNRLAGIIAGFAYAFVPNRIAHIEHLNVLTGQWMPLAVLATRRALMMRSNRWTLALGATIFIQGISGVYFLYFTAVILGVVLVTYLLWERSRAAIVMSAKIAAVSLVACILLIPTLWPYQQVSQDFGIERTPEDVALWSARREDYLAVPLTNRMYGPGIGVENHRDLEQDLFPGVALVVLALAGLAYPGLRWERLMLLLLGLTAYLFSFGLSFTLFDRDFWSPYQWLYDYVPGFRAMRVAARFGGNLLPLALAGLAGLGVAWILNEVRRHVTGVRARALTYGAVVVFLGGTMTMEYTTHFTPADPLPVSLEEAQRPDYAWMAENPAPTIELPMGEGDVASAWPNYWSIFHWSPVVNGYSAIAPPGYYPLRDRMREFPSERTIELLQGMGVETVVYHLEPEADPEDDPVPGEIDRFPQLTMQIGPPDYVWTLEADPWMWRLVESLPGRVDVDLPMLEDDPPLFGMLAAILQRESHTVYGRGMLDYWQLPDAPDDICHVVLLAGTSPENAGYPDAEPLRTDGPVTLFQPAGCAE